MGLLILTALALFIAYQPQASYAIVIGEQRAEIELEGANAPEHNDQVGAYRWTKDRTIIHIRPIGGPLNVQLKVQGYRPADVPNPTLRFSIDGRELAQVETSNALQQVDLTIPASQAALSRLELQIDTPTFINPGDPRALGVLLAGVTVESNSGWNWPNRTPLGQALLAILLVYAAGRFAGGRRRAAFIFSLLCLLLLSGTLANDRATVAQWGWLWLVIALTILAFGAYRAALAGFFGGIGKAIRAGNLPGGAYSDLAEAPNVPGWLPPALVVGAALIALLHLAAPLLPADNQPLTNYRWGFDFYGLLPGWLGWASAALVLVFMVPQVNRFALAWLARGVEFIRGYTTKLNPYWLLALTGVVSSVLLWLARNRTPLGDSVELIKKIELSYLWHEREQLDYYIHLKLTQAFAPLGATALGVYQVVSALAGGLAVIGITLIAARVAAPGRRWLVAGFALATANMLLFAGYVESYTLATLVVIWFLLALLLYVRGKAPAGVPAFLLALALWLHPSTAFFLPALLAGILLKQSAWATKIREAAVMLAAGLLVFMVVGSVFLVEGYSWSRWQVAQSQLGGVDPGTFKPLFVVSGSREYYPIFSWQQLGAIMQEQLLLAPLALIVIVLAAIGLRRCKGSGRDLGVLLFAALGALVFSATWNPDLGATKDWDLLGLSGIPLALLAGTMLATRWPKGTGGKVMPRGLAYAGSVLVATSAWHALAWIAVNAVGR